MTTADRSVVKVRRSDGVAAQLVISVPVINWASRAPNPRRRTICVAPSATQQLQPPPAVNRDYTRRSTSPWSVTLSRDRSQSGYNYGRSWYDGLDQLG